MTTLVSVGRNYIFAPATPTGPLVTFGDTNLQMMKVL
jgi:hypothetical protein